MSAGVNPTSRAPYRERLRGLAHSRRGKRFGAAEVAALAGSCLVLLLVLFSYLYFVVPARSNVAALTEDKARLQANLQTLEGVVNRDQDTTDQVDRITTSLSEFEAGHLLPADQGRLSLYDELNQMIVRNNLRNTSGPTYTSLDPLGTRATPGKSVTTKWQSFYPGIAVMVTVEGQYQNVRRFIRDLERSRQFVVINQVELQRANENSAPASADESGPGTSGSLISLQLNLATYFQRDNAAASSGQPQE